MNMSQAFSELNSILHESATTDELKKTLADIDQLDAEIKELQKEKSDGWAKDYEHKLAAERAALSRISQELDSLVREYRSKKYTEFDQDGDPTNFEIIDNDRIKKEVSIIEASIKDRLSQVRADYEKLLAQVKSDHAAAYATHTQKISDKNISKASASTRKETLLKTIIEEAKEELAPLVNRATKQVQATPLWEKLKISKDKLILEVVMPAGVFCVDDDYINQDYDGSSIDQDKIYNNMMEEVYEDGHFSKLADCLGIDEAFVDAADEGDLLEIPSCSWKLDYEVDLDYTEPEITHEYYDPGNYWNPPEYDIEYDEEVDWSIIFYLIKEI